MKAGITYGEKYGSAMEVTDQAKADAYFEECVRHCMSHGKTRAVGSSEIVRRRTCPRCRGKKYVVLIAGPHIRDGVAFCGGPLRYDCNICGGTGKVKPPERSN